MKFKAGRYYIGDPCYVIKDWDAFIDVKYPGDSREPLQDVQFQGHDVWVGNTAFGDGEYGSECGTLCCGVDSGTIGVVPLGLIDEATQEKEASNIIEFDEDFEASVDEDGEFTIGDFTIATKWATGEDTDDEWEDEEDEFEDDDDLDDEELEGDDRLH